MQTNDLIYLNGPMIYEQAKKELLEAFPDIIISDASDEIHPYRLAINTNANQEELNLWLLTHGYHDVSLNLGLLMKSKPENFHSLLEKAMKIMKDAETAINAKVKQKVPPNQNHP